MKQWYVQRQGGAITGPFALESLRAELQRSDSQTHTFVNEVGTKDWVLCTTVPELAAFADALPPPVEVRPTKWKRLAITLLPIAAFVVLSGALAMVVVLQTRRAEALDGELHEARAELEAVHARIDGVESHAHAAAASAVTEVDAVRSSVAQQHELLVLIGERTEGIGFRSIAWSYRGLAGVNTLEVKVKSVPKKTACRVWGNFQFSNRDLLPRDATARLSDDGGAQLFETKVDLSEGAFAFEAPVACEQVAKLFLSR